MVMKIALTSKGKDLDSDLDERFGRARHFIIYDTETESFETIDNEQNLNSPQGAGVQAAETIAKTGAASLVTGHCGPKAFRALTAAGIKVFTTNATTVKEALDLYLAGKLTEADNADVEGHW